jgi:hypothetical protein
MNNYQRAVIGAARSWCRNAPEHMLHPIDIVLRDAVKALEAHEKAQSEAGIIEVGWHEVAAGDELRGKSGTLYPVVGVQAITGSKWQIRIKMPNGEHSITRPTEKEPRAAVRRGPDGAAVDMFVNVFTSGGEM